jgi:hypothetical protein
VADQKFIFEGVELKCNNKIILFCLLYILCSTVYKIYDTHNLKIEQKRELSRERNTGENAIVFVEFQNSRTRRR